MTRNPLELINEQVTAAIKEAVISAGIVAEDEIPAIVLEVPKDKSHGDLATNAAMQLTRIAKKNPRMIAEQIINHLDLSKASIESAEIAGPGFINFRLSKSYLYPVIELIHEQGDDYGRVNMGEGRKIQMEFVSANPTGSFILDMPGELLLGMHYAMCLILQDMKSRVSTILMMPAIKCLI